ncbi:MAG: hypothetical protein ACM3JJ_04340 [Hyphomicrobiales bacterium]
MSRKLLVCLAFLVFVAVPAGAADEPPRPDPAALISAQREAMKRLAYMDGVWRGPAWTLQASGEKRTLTQTERIGPFLDGSVRVIEGRGYDADGKVVFNALGIVSYDPLKHAYSIHSYALGQSGDFPFLPNDQGYVWEIPAGPAKIRYTAVITDSTWKETGERTLTGKEPVQIFEMNLRRVGGTDWPAGGAIPPK